MRTYDAVKSARESIEQIFLNQETRNSISPHHYYQIISIYELVIYLQNHCRLPELPSLESEIRRVAYEAQWVVEHIIAVCNGLPDKSGECKTDFNQPLKEIREMIDSTVRIVRRQVMRMEKRDGNTTDEDSQPSDLLAATSSSILAHISKLEGVDILDYDSTAIKYRLCGGSSKLQVIPIVGMGGIGKTTLATNVYNDPLIIQHFDVRAWVTVSQDYSTQKIVSSLMHSMKEFVTNKSREGDEITIFRSLKCRRYLIVMDDMWNKDVWDDVRNLFPADDDNGSCIMLTTRLSDVAAYPDPHSPLHEMHCMSSDQSWHLLRQRVLVDPELEQIGKMIAESCKGLPLAIVVIAGLLSKVEKSFVSWLEFAQNVSSIVVSENGRFDSILSLSYTHLPHHLRPCFLYLGGFPEDHKIRISKLVKLWVADGLLIHSEGSSKSLEEEAEECLEDLVERNLVLVTERKTNGQIKSCSLHDLIRDWCIRKAQENKFFLNLVDTYFGTKKHFVEVIRDQHRISIKSSSLKYLSSPDCSTIHTVMCFRNVSINLDFLKSVKFLRVLDVENLAVSSLPDELFDLFHLRYLAIQFEHDFVIPAAISKLQNLQTLIIDARSVWKLLGRPAVYCLPREIWKLTQLRHLICYRRLLYPEGTTSTLENLQTLSFVLHVMCAQEILENIPNIKKLGIDCSYYEHGTHLTSLAKLHQLENLRLRNADWRKDSICFPSMLRKLSLCNMSLPWSEMSVVGSLPNLQVLKLRDFACIGSTWETSQGEFPELQFLLIENSKLKHWITQSDHFPSLEFMLLHDCMCLNEIPEDIGEIATLQLIEVKGYSYPVPKSLAESAKMIQVNQQFMGNDTLQVLYPLADY